MRLIYICDECGGYIDEIEMEQLNEIKLGFHVLTPDELEDMVHLDWDRQVGTVRAICDACWEKKQFSDEDHHSETEYIQ